MKRNKFIMLKVSEEEKKKIKKNAEKKGLTISGFLRMIGVKEVNNDKS